MTKKISKINNIAQYQSEKMRLEMECHNTEEKLKQHLSYIKANPWSMLVQEIIQRNSKKNFWQQYFNQTSSAFGQIKSINQWQEWLPIVASFIAFFYKNRTQQENNPSEQQTTKG